MKNKFLIFFFLMLNNCFLLSQGFSNRYIIDQTAIIFQRIIQTEDTIVTMGLGSTFYSPYPSKLMFTKFDYEGEVFSYDLIIGDSLTHYYPLSSSANERKIIIVGGAGESNTIESGFYALYDLDNGIEWIKQYYPSNGWTLFFEDCLFLDDKIYILANLQDHNNGSIISTKLICTDLIGNILWEKDFGNNNFHIRPGSITINQNGNIYLGLERNNFPSSQGYDPFSLIYELDLEGNVISEWINDELNTLKPNEVIEVADSSLLFVGSYYYGISSFNNQVYQGYICLLDSLNNRVWSLKTGTPTIGTILNNLIPTMDGNFITIGNTLDSLSSSQQLTHSGHIIKFNIVGEIIWEKRHFAVDTDAEYNRLYDIVELPDSSLLLCGESVDVFGDFPTQGWLLKLDKYGNIDSTVSISPPKNIVFENKNIHVYPNPAKEQIQIELTENINIDLVEIFDTSGKIIESKKYKAWNNHSVNFNISHFHTGIYLVRVNKKYLKKISVF